MKNSQSYKESSMNGIESIPIDLIAKILSNLPAKSVGKFRCVSKLWASKFEQSYSTYLFLTRSSRPHLLFSLWLCLGSSRNWCCLSSPQPHNPDENSSIALNFRMDLGLGCAPVSGLVFCPRVDTPDNILESRICNPATGQYVDLPLLTRKRNSWEFFGYDPIGKQYKLLCMSEGPGGIVARYHIFTFPCGKNESWRSIQCPSPTRHRPFSSGICINGILYYVGRKEYEKSRVIVCFDVRSEEFKFVDVPKDLYIGSRRQNVCLTKFNGKLVLISSTSVGDGTTKLELCVGVLEDDKKPDWSVHVYRLTLPFYFFVNLVGMIGTGEIVLAPLFGTSHPFYVFYFNPEKNTLKKVEIQGMEAFEDPTVDIYLDHVENVSFIT